MIFHNLTLIVNVWEWVTMLFFTESTYFKCFWFLCFVGFLSLFLCRRCFFTSKSDWSRNFSHCGIAKGKRFGAGTKHLSTWLGWSLDQRMDSRMVNDSRSQGVRKRTGGKKWLEAWAVSERSSCRGGFLNLSTTDLSGWKILCGGGLSRAL